MVYSLFRLAYIGRRRISLTCTSYFLGFQGNRSWRVKFYFLYVFKVNLLIFISVPTMLPVQWLFPLFICLCLESWLETIKRISKNTLLGSQLVALLFQSNLWDHTFTSWLPNIASKRKGNFQEGWYSNSSCLTAFYETLHVSFFLPFKINKHNSPKRKKQWQVFSVKLSRAVADP